MLHQQSLKFPKIIRLKSPKNLHIFLGHFKRSTLEIQATRPRRKNKSQIDMENSAILANHDIGIISILYIEEILDKTKS
jgi:hypothetical protein